jgi:hypothetical protein
LAAIAIAVLAFLCVHVAVGELRADRGSRHALVGGWWLVSARHFEGPIAQGTAGELGQIEARYGEVSVAGPATSGA